MPPQSILVIGAGAAGLAAARDLSRAGCEVIVLEARNRIGGRILTHKDPESPVAIELGAEFVHGKSPAIWQLVKAAHLELYEVSERRWFFEDGQLSRSRDFWKKIDSLLDKMKSSAADQSLKEFLASLSDDEETRHAKSMLIRYVEGFHAASIERVSIRSLIKAKEASESIDGDKAFRFLNGYDSLTKALRAEAESYGTKFHLNMAVKEVDWRGRELEVACEHTVDYRSASESDVGPGSKEAELFRASAAVITLPLGVLQITSDQQNGLRFIPELPETMQAAIRNLAMGNVLKLNLRFRERFWEDVKLWDRDTNRVSFADAGFFHYPDAPFPTWWTQLPIRAPLLVGWVGGPRAERMQAPGARRQEPGGREQGSSPTVRESSSILGDAIASLARIFNIPSREIRDQLETSYIHDWHNDPFTRGAYSYVPVNGLESQRTLSEPVDNKLFFAGEATSIGHFGTVHGAIQSGQRAANEILNL